MKGCSLALRSPKLAILSGSLRKAVADENSARWNGAALATPKTLVKSASCRRQFAVRKNTQSSPQQPPLKKSYSQKAVRPQKVSGRRRRFDGCLKLHNGTSLDNPLLSSFDSAVSLHVPAVSCPGRQAVRQPLEAPAVVKRPLARPCVAPAAVQLPAPVVVRAKYRQRRHTLTSAELELAEPVWKRAASKKARPAIVADAFKSSLAFLC